MLKVALRLEGLARNCSVHAAGVVISPQPLTELVPLYKTNRDEIVTQFDMNGLEKLGLLKMDFLGLTTLTLIQDALRLIQKRHGVEVVPEDLPLDDQATYEIFSKGFTSGVFQFESSGMRDILRRYQPSRIEDLTALNALYRPGPIQGGMIDDFIERKWGRRAVQYDLAGTEGTARRDLRRDRLPGAGDADLQPPGRLFAGRCRPAAPRHGQEEGWRRWPSSASASSRARWSADSRRGRSRRFST